MSMTTAPEDGGRDTPTGWTTGGIRLLAALLVGFEVIQGLLDPFPPGNLRFTQSYYLVTYDHGFLRRGLSGEGLHLLFGVPTPSEVDITSDLVVVLAVVAVVVVIEVLIRRGTASAWAMAILLAATPFTIDFFIVDRRPDLLALVLLVALGLVLTRAGRTRLRWLIVFGVGFGALVLVHEDVILVEVPWALVLTAAVTVGPGDEQTGDGVTGVGRLVGTRLTALAVLPVVATVALLAYGLPSSGRVAALENDVSTFHFTGNTVFTYLPDSISASLRLVGEIPGRAKFETLLLGFVLIALSTVWIVRWVTPRVWSPFLRPGHRALGAGLAGLVAVTTVILFATGFDWVRWFADCGAAWLIVQAFVVLGPATMPPASGAEGGDVRTADEPPGLARPAGVRIALPGWLPALAVYLVAVPPLDVLYVSDQLRHFLFFV
jgi:hypothetical protein